MDDKALIRAAIAARSHSYSPYSNFSVGAALLSKSGKIYGGCNIENAAYSPTNCAERTAFFTAISAGERDFSAIAIVGGFRDGALGECAPCGVCRQVMMEFCGQDKFIIILAKSEEEYRRFTLSELLPLGFGPHTIKGDYV